MTREREGKKNKATAADSSSISQSRQPMYYVLLFRVSEISFEFPQNTLAPVVEIFRAGSRSRIKRRIDRRA